MSDHIPRLNAALEGRYVLNDVIGVGGMATVRSDDDFEVLSIEVVVVGPYRGIEPHPDGQSFIAIKRPPPDSTLVIADESRRLDFVVNWAEELRARLGGA